MTHVAEALPDRLEHRDLTLTRRRGHRSHEDERRDDREERERVDHEQATEAERDVQDPTEHRPRQLRTVEGHRVEADRAHQVALAHQARDHRLARRRVEREDGRAHRSDGDDRDDVDLPGDREEREEQRVERRRGLRHEQQASPVCVVRHDSGEQPEGEARQRAREAEQADVEGREVRDAVADRELHDEVAEAKQLHPAAHVRDHHADPEQAEVPVAQGGGRGRATGVHRCNLRDRDARLLGHCESAWESNPPRNAQTPRQRF